MIKTLEYLEKKYSWIPYVEASISYICIVLLQMTMKIIVRTITPLFAIYCRAIILFCVNTWVLISQGSPLTIKDSLTFKLQVGRAILSTTTFCILMISVQYLPIAIVNSLFYMGPIFIFFVEAFH